VNASSHLLAMQAVVQLNKLARPSHSNYACYTPLKRSILIGCCSRRPTSEAESESTTLYLQPRAQYTRTLHPAGAQQ